MNKLFYIIGGTIAILLAGWYGFIFTHIENKPQGEAEKIMGEVSLEQYKDIPINEKYSYQSLPNRNFQDIDPKEFNNTKIIGTNFSKDDQPFSDIFPKGMTGVVFYRCNLDNVRVPEGNTIYDYYADKNTNKQMKYQNDNELWLVDEDLKPVEPFNKEQFQELGISIDPKDIPPIKMNGSIIQFEIEQQGL